MSDVSETSEDITFLHIDIDNTRRLTVYHSLTWQTTYVYRGNDVIHEEDYVTGDRWVTEENIH